MATEPKTIHVEPGSELDRLLDKASDAPVVLERHGEHYHLTREPAPDIWAGYDAEKFAETVQALAGSLSESEADEMIANIYRWREGGLQPADRP